jgi:hypothetical protein
MDSTTIASLVGFITAIAGSVISHFLLLRHAKRQFAEYYRNKLFEKQLAAYERLWAILYPTSRATTDKTVVGFENGKAFFRAKIAAEFCESITQYFFSENGLYLSKSTRNVLFDVRDILQEMIYSPHHGEKFELSTEDRKRIRTSFMNLQTTIRDDLGLRALKFKPEDIGVDEKYLEP